jgi:hypothetical protein
MNWKSFALGVVCGAIVAFMFFHSMGQRYRVEASGPSGLIVIRLDTWTGQSWMQRYYDNNGAKIFYWEPLEVRQK